MKEARLFQKAGLLHHTGQLIESETIMNKTVHAVFENGVFRPTEKVDLPDPCEVEVEVHQVSEPARKPTLDDVYAILGKRHSSGEHDLAERHDEHQP